ncbi:hypothetical protein [Streptomyces beijiangensis]|uniref:Uncharacterized protein n=1 Tax=Streptomyces beijiangensis TaxID=163361 RepID=A0A939F5E5_9ACTN|nr:hypothetical protein [Streptomyces beijiangensis]MBO0511347.1 hypothetical protein [Streptomyces beijiangensis]
MTRYITGSIIAGLLSVAAVGGVLVAPASSASADTRVTPKTISYKCSSWKNDAGTIGYAECTNLANIDRFRAKVTCISYTGAQHIEYGAWVGNNKKSSHKCAGADAGQAGVYHTGYQVDLG